MSYNKLKSLVANVEAIETAMKIQVQGRQATAEEKEILSRYSGFGGIKEVLNIGTDKPIGGDMQEPIQRLQELINAYPHFTEPMRHNVIEGIKASVLTAFYTPKFLVDAVVRQIHATFSENGLKMRSFLEPSAGIGGFLPIAMSGTYDYAIEKDLISGMILSLLHENTLTRTAAFETIGEQGFEHTTFDVIASNIPFGNFRVFDAELWKKGGMYEQATKTIHNYFFVKAMELLNEGGLLAFITSRGIADTPGNKFVREYLVNHADLISAIRLPDMLFMQTSGIEVGSDLLIFQKHTHKTVLSQREQLFLQVGREKADAIGTMTEYANKLFTMPKTTLATGSRIVQNQYGKYVRKYQWQGNENAMSQYLAALLKLDFGRYFRKSLFTGNGQGSEHMQMSLFGNVAMKQVEKGKRAYTDGVEAWMKDGAMVLFEGQVGTIQYRKSSLYQEVAIDFVPVDEGKVNTDRAKDYFPIRKAYFELSIKEREEQKEDNGLRRELNARYDAFVAKWGCFHENDNKEFIMLDSLGVEVFTIEMQLGKDLVKSDIMREPVAFKKIDPNKRLTPIEALASSLNFYGKVDMDYLMQSTDSAEEEIIGDLKGEIFYNPAIGEWEHKGKFLSGNVIAKCKEIGSYLSELTDREKDWTETAVRALADATPEAIPYEELDINMGERWIDTKLYADFATELFKVETSVMYFDVNDTYMVRLQSYSPVAYNTYFVRNYNGEDLFVHALHDTGTKTGDTYYAKSYPCSDMDKNSKIELYGVPVYYVYIKGTDDKGQSVKYTWKALRFMPYYNPPNFSSYKTIGWVNSGLHKLNRQPAPEYKKAYEVHNTYSQHNGAIVLKGTFYIHAGPEDLTHIGWGAAGCVEIIGSFSEFKDQVKELSGSTQVDADSAISELVFYKKLYIEIEYATPPNIKANFYKEVSIKRR